MEEGERADLFVALKQNDSPALVSSRKVVTGRVELNGRDNIGCTQDLSNEGLRRVGLKGTGRPSVMSSTSPLSPKH
jgi:hypothetical protein